MEPEKNEKKMNKEFVKRIYNGEIKIEVKNIIRMILGHTGGPRGSSNATTTV